MTGPYLEAGGGYVNQTGLPNNFSTVNGVNPSFYSGASYDIKHLGGNVIFGYNYDITSWFGLGAEIGWTYYGENTLNYKDTAYGDLLVFSPVQSEATAWDIALVGTWHVSNAFDLFAKVGYANVNYSFDYDASDGNFSAFQQSGESFSHNNFRPLLGLGIGYNITNSLQVNLTYSHIFGDDMAYFDPFTSDQFDEAMKTNNSVPCLDGVMINLKYTFGKSLFNKTDSVGQASYTGAMANYTGFYISGEAGWTMRTGLFDYGELARSFQALGYTLSKAQSDRDKLGGRLSIGYNYDITPRYGLGAELGWGYYGQDNSTFKFGIANIPISIVSQNHESKYYVWDLAAIGTWHISPQFDFFIKGGGANVISDNTSVSFDATGQANLRQEYFANRWEPLLGFGLGYNVSRDLEVTVVYTHIFGDDIAGEKSGNIYQQSDLNQVPTIESAFIGIRYRL